MKKPTDCISVADGKKLQANWNSTRAVDIERGQGSKDPCCFTFNIDQLQEYIDYVKEQTKGDLKQAGIRVYFAAYDNQSTDKSTVFFCASESDNGNSNNNYNVDPLNRGNTGWPPKAF